MQRNRIDEENTLGHTRRATLQMMAVTLAATGGSVRAEDSAVPLGASPEALRWFDELNSQKAFDAPVRLTRFADPIFIVYEPFTWTPNADNGPGLHAYTVPKGFVTDLASIPPLLFPWFRADDDYAQAAILHDYLYWTQPGTRAEADDLFRIGMRDLEVKPSTVTLLYEGVRTFGQRAWDDNGKLRRAGERRLLRKFPTKASIRWNDWKQEPGVFDAAI